VDPVLEHHPLLDQVRPAAGPPTRPRPHLWVRQLDGRTSSRRESSASTQASMRSVL
jgi:hypothetical protein